MLGDITSLWPTPFVSNTLSGNVRSKCLAGVLLGKFTMYSGDTWGNLQNSHATRPSRSTISLPINDYPIRRQARLFSATVEELVYKRFARDSILLNVLYKLNWIKLNKIIVWLNTADIMGCKLKKTKPNAIWMNAMYFNYRPNSCSVDTLFRNVFVNIHIFS